jgi:DNA-binding NarL/FixJ family response regulator
MNRIQVLIVDDHPLFRRGVRWSLESESDILVVGEAGDGQSAVQQADQLVPDVVLIDINMPVMSGLEVTRILKRRHPQTGVIVFTMHEDDEQLFHAIRVGAAAYITKDVEASEVIKLIRRVARGEYLINENVLSRPFVATRVLDQFRELSQMEQATDGVFSPLTPREVEILDCVAQGNSNKEIARILSISDQTVKNHITSILRKLAVNDRTQAVIYALRHGWIKLDEEEEADAIGPS